MTLLDRVRVHIENRRKPEGQLRRELNKANRKIDGLNAKVDGLKQDCNAYEALIDQTGIDLSGAMYWAQEEVAANELLTAQLRIAEDENTALRAQLANTRQHTVPAPRDRRKADMRDTEKYDVTEVREQFTPPSWAPVPLNRAPFATTDPGRITWGTGAVAEVRA